VSEKPLVLALIASFSKDLPVPPAGPRPITLDQFLKQTGVVESGGQAKIAIQEGYITVNGELETRRGRKLSPGDVIVVDDELRFVVPPPGEAVP
jgi:ribosome-associated protein